MQGPHGTENDQMPSTIPGRVNTLEQTMHTLNHQMTVLDNETIPLRLVVLEQSVRNLDQATIPARVQNLEASVNHVRKDVDEIKNVSKDIGQKLDNGLRDLQNQQSQQQNFVRGILWAGGFVVALLQLSPLLTAIVKRMIAE